MKVPVIYALIDPLTNDVRYIGKTHNELYKRLSGHYKDKRKTYKTHWIASLKDKGLKPSIIIIEECTLENWEKREKYWIDYYRKLDCGLTNWLEGGQGLPIGYKHTPEAKEKIRIAAKRDNAGKFKKGRPHDPKQSEGNWKHILQYDLEGNFVQEWKGIINAAKETGISKNTIGGCVKGKFKRGGNFQWKAFTENYSLNIGKYINSSVKHGLYSKIYFI